MHNERPAGTTARAPRPITEVLRMGTAHSGERLVTRTHASKNGGMTTIECPLDPANKIALRKAAEVEKRRGVKVLARTQGRFIIVVPGHDTVESWNHARNIVGKALEIRAAAVQAEASPQLQIPK
jgi:hypothetical protein